MTRIINALDASLAVVIAAVAIGCSTPSDRYLYPGDERPADQVAIVVVPWQIQIRRVNDRRIAPAPFGGSQKEARVRILPGSQEWLVRYVDPFAADRTGDPYAFDRSGDIAVRFEAIAGHTYRLAFVTPHENPALRDAAQQVLVQVTDGGNGETRPFPAAPAATPPPAEVRRDATAPAPVEAAPPGTPQPLEDATLEQLKKWWTVAGDRERQAFLHWIREAR